MRKPKRRVRTPSSPRSASAPRSPRKEATPPSRPKKSGGSAKGFDRGAVGFRKAAEKKQRQDDEYERRKNTPFSFRLKPGDQAEVIVLDNEPPFFVSMHKVKDHQGRWQDEVCIADTGQRCPLCESLGKEGSYTMYLTVLDRRPYTTRTGQTIKASRKLFPVKGRNLAKFERQYKRLNGQWRGLKINCHRDGDKEAAIGEDLEFMGKVKEALLDKYGENGKPVDYTSIFSIPSAGELAKRYNLSMDGVPGQEEFDNDDDEDDYDASSGGWKN